MPSSVITPSLKPVQPVQLELVDDQSVVFRPQFGRTWTQRNSFGDPRWRMRLSFQGMRDYDRARLRTALLEARGQYVPIRISPYQTFRGSFPRTELLSQSTEFTTTSGLTASHCSISVVDRMLRMEVTQNNASNAPLFYQTSGVGSAGSAYVARGAIMVPSNQYLYAGVYVNQFPVAPVGAGYTYQGRGLLTTAGVLDGAGSPNFVMYNIPGHGAGDYCLWPYVSMARCALVDAGQNYLKDSNNLTTGNWTASNVNVAANTAIDPWGQSVASSINDGSSSGLHYVDQSYTTSSSSEVWNVSLAMRYSSGQWIFIQVYSSSGSVYTYVDLQNIAFGTASTSGTWSNRTRGLDDLGNSWRRISVGGIKPAGDTTVTVRIGLANGDGVSSFTGAFRGSYVSRVTLSKSNLPTRNLIATTTDVVSNSATGSTIAVTGLPASTAGLVLPGDFFEINGELKECTAPLNSAADGTGWLSFRPQMGRPASHMDAVIFHEPMGRFILSEGGGFESRFGSYQDSAITLDEVYE